MGSTPHAHAQANVEKPHDQGVVAMIGVFIDTFVVLTMTALVIISTLYANGSTAWQGVAKTNAMQVAFETALPGLGKFGAIFVAICLLFFAFSTIIGWNFFGKINVQYLFKNSKVATVIYSVIAIAFIFLGTLASNDLVWELTDFFNYLMVLPNAIALFALSAIVVKASKSNKDK
jgi:AGCS family alanine or glycine:cation symporter